MGKTGDKDCAGFSGSGATQDERVFAIFIRRGVYELPQLVLPENKTGSRSPGAFFQARELFEPLPFKKRQKR